MRPYNENPRENFKEFTDESTNNGVVGKKTIGNLKSKNIKPYLIVGGIVVLLTLLAIVIF